MFFEKGRALIPAEACSAVLSKCIHSFKITTEYLDEYHNAFSNVMNAFQGIPPFVFRYFQDHINALTKRQSLVLELSRDLQKHNVHSLIKAYVQSSGPQSAQAGYALCSMFINLAHPTYIEHLAEILNKSKNLLDYFKNEYDKHNPTSSARYTPSSSSSTSNYLPPPGQRK